MVGENDLVCCSVNSIADPSAKDDDSSSEPQVEVDSGNLSDCEDPSENDDDDGDDDGDVHGGGGCEDKDDRFPKI